MAGLEYKLIIFGVLMTLSRFSDETMVQSRNGENHSHPDVINIDDNWHHGSKEGHKKPQVKVIIDREHVTGFKGDTDDEDDGITDGSGSGDKEIIDDSKPDIALTMYLTNDSKLVVQEGGANDIPGTENENTEKDVKLKATSITPKDEIKATNREQETRVLNLTEIIEGGTEETKNPCDDIDCKFGSTCVQNGVNTYECVCPVYSCNEQPGNPVCGSDGLTYSNPCELDMTICKEQKNITIAKYDECNGEMDMCPERNAAKWSPWSMWFQSGHSEFRIRFCMSLSGNSELPGMCDGHSTEWRKCKVNEEKTCMTPFGEKKKHKTSSCTGVDVNDMQTMKNFFPDWKEKGEVCRFSIYDSSDDKFVHSNWTYKKLQNKGDKVLWCNNHRGVFIPFTSPYPKCRELLKNFCIKPQVCRYKNRKPLKSRGDIRHKCWKKFLLGQKLPTGFPDLKKYFICQRFADNTYLAKVYGGKDAFYGTLYDTKNRSPLLSFGRFSDLGDMSWPAVPFMLEKGILKKESSILNLFFGKKKSGGMMFKDMTHASFADRCQKGEQQALEIDYDGSSYRILQLISPDMIGSQVSKRIATFALTNTIPVHTSVYSAWRKAIQSIRKYAVDLCGLPVVNNINTKKSHRKAHNFPDIYVVAGGVPSSNITIGNGVNVPRLIWLTGCCVRGGEAKSFSIYVKNVNNGQIHSGSVKQLEALLSNLYNTTQSINIFPAYNGICSDIHNDVSKYIYV